MTSRGPYRSRTATKEQIAEERYHATEKALIAMHCAGCPYHDCVGSTAMLPHEEQTKRYREEARK